MSKEIYCLFEEYEKLNGRYNYHLLAMSTEKDLLRELIKAKVAADEHGLIAQKGVEYYDEDTFRTNSDFSFGYIKYFISNEINLSREELAQKISTEQKKAKTTFEQTIWTYPKSKEVCNFMRECRDGDLNMCSLLAFLAESKDQAGLNEHDIQFLKNNMRCQNALYDAMCEFLEKDESIPDRNNVRSFYSDERKTILINVLTSTYKEYKAAHQE